MPKPSLIVGPSGPARAVYNFLWNRWYINPVYYRVFVYGAISAAGALWRTVELGFFDRISGAVALFSVDLSSGGQMVDVWVIDGAINWITSVGRKTSMTLRKIQTGITQDYVTIFAVGLIVLFVTILFFLT